jgi:hypothetical protein
MSALGLDALPLRTGDMSALGLDALPLRTGDMSAHKKPHLPTKTCLTCGLPFAWRKKWRRTWPAVKYCSERCRRNSKSRTMDQSCS